MKRFSRRNRDNSGPVDFSKFSDLNRNGSTQKETHSAVCSDCGKECKVPFKPSQDRPIYCRECYPKHKIQRD